MSSPTHLQVPKSTYTKPAEEDQLTRAREKNRRKAEVRREGGWEREEGRERGREREGGRERGREGGGGREREGGREGGGGREREGGRERGRGGRERGGERKGEKLGRRRGGGKGLHVTVLAELVSVLGVLCSYIYTVVCAGYPEGSGEVQVLVRHCREVRKDKGT